MAGQPQTLPGPIRLADYLSVGLLARLIPPSLVDQALTEHGKHSQRQRDLPAHAVAYYVMALSLYQGTNTEEVLRVVTEGMNYLGAPTLKREVGKSGISAARTRLGADVMHALACHTLKPLANPDTPGAFYRQLRLVSLDGSTLEVADEAANRSVFGVPGTGQGQTGYPQLRFTALLEHGTRALFGVTLGAYTDAEVGLAAQSLVHLQPNMLCLADRGLAGYPLWAQAVSTGAHLLWRIPKNRVLPVQQRLADGSYLSQMRPAAQTRRRLVRAGKSASLSNPTDAGEVGGPAPVSEPVSVPAPPLTVRVIDYRLPGVPGAEPIYRLITTLLDPVQAPAAELAALYQSRWSIESTFADLKTTLKGAQAVLRSKTPALVRQEFWGLLLAHHVVRKLMWEASLAHTPPPDQLSFKHALSVMRRKLPASGALSPSAVPELVGQCAGGGGRRGVDQPEGAVESAAGEATNPGLSALSGAAGDECSTGLDAGNC
jgi:hypothetical protein